MLNLIKQSNQLLYTFKQTSGLRHQVFSFKHLKVAFFRSHRGHEQEPGVEWESGSSAFFQLALDCILRLCRRRLEIAQTCRPSKLELSTSAVVSCKTSSTMLLISRDTGGYRTGARHRSSSAGWGRRQACMVCACMLYTRLYTKRENKEDANFNLDPFITTYRWNKHTLSTILRTWT